MTKFKILAGIVLSALCLSARADLGYSQYSTFGTQFNSSVTNYAVISNNSRNGGDPIITYFSATSDLSSSKLQFYSVTNQTSEANGTTNSTTTCTVNSTNGFTPAQFVVIEHIRGDTYEFDTVNTVQNTNQIVLNVAPLNPVLPGDNIYVENAVGYIPIGATTVSVNGVGIYSGKRNKPLLLTLTGTSSDSINAVSATYIY